MTSDLQRSPHQANTGLFDGNNTSKKRMGRCTESVKRETISTKIIISCKIILYMEKKIKIFSDKQNLTQKEEFKN